jgi:S-DNA-T family DNA segregation ATPase FtsK/SpoIIIE
MAFADRAASRPFSAAARPAVEAAPAAPPAARDRVRDVTALVLLAACVFLVAALTTFDPKDPPLAHGFPPHARATNACGVLGATAAATSFQWFGLGAWFVAALLAALDVALLRRRVLADLPLRAAGAAVATAGVCTLLALFLPDWVDRPLWGAGGRAGAVGRLLAEAWFARTGAAIVVTALTMAGLFVACDAVVLRLLAGCAAAGAWMVAGVAGLRDRWAARRARLAETAAGPIAADAAVSGFRGRPFVLSSAADDDAGADDGDDDEPTIRVRRREPPLPIATVVEADDDHEEVADDAVDADMDADEDDAVVEPARPAVPIRSLSSRRKAPEPLVLSPEPAGEYELPALDLLLPTEYLELDQQEQEVRDRAKVLEKTFAEFGFKVKVVEIETGPVISQYEIELEAGLRLAKITNLADDLAIALRVPSVRIVAPIPGKNSVGIEVPNTTRQMVRLREVIEETQAKARTMKIPIFLGKDVAGNPMVVDMASMPHLLIAGRTGTGKSVCLNSIIVSMLMTRRPDEVRMLMIDPKMVELTPYKSLPHLMHPVVTDMKKAEAILAWAVDKMEERYALLAKVGVRHLTQYNALGRETILERMKPETEEEAAAIPTTMPFIVMIADEIADMMMTAGKEIEAHIIRLAQKSRAVGIHLILATQKPTVDVITGLIKSNLPARIAFQVASRTDSRVVLDEMGAERLLGNGDMLFLSPGTSQILRGQGTFLSDDEIGRVMAAIGTSEPQYAAELVNLQPAPAGDAAKGGPSPKDKDELYDAAVEVVIREGRGSVSLLQRALGVGYGRGARLIDFMAEDGVVGQYAGSQAREVLLTMEQWAARNGTAPLPPDPAPRRLKIQPHAHEAAPAVVLHADEDEQDEDEGGWDDESDDLDAADDDE